MSNSKAVSRPSYAAAMPAEQVKVRLKPLYYAAAFLIPAALMFIAYAIFGVYPFGERSVLTLDLNGQYVYYFENIRDAFWSGENPLYSWSRNLSGGYQGVIGYYLASPFTFIVILMPRSLIIEALMIMQLCKIGACGVTFYHYAVKSKGVPYLQAVIFSTMYALMAYVAIQLIDPMWIDGPIFLPLVILGLEYLVDDGRKINYIIPLAIMFIANFYIGFMIAIFVAIYFVYYLFFGAKNKFRTFDYFKTIGRMILATGVVLMCSFIMIFPVYKALALGKFDFSQPDYSFKTMFNPLELIATLLPNQYYSVNVDEGTRMYGRPEIYCGVLSLILVPLYYFNSKIKTNRKIGYSLLMAIMFLSMWIKPLNMMWHGGQDPNWLPYRYSFLVSFVLVSMAAETFANLDGYKLKAGPPIGVFGVLMLLIFIFESVMKTFNYNEDRYKYVAIAPYSENVTINGESRNHLFLGTLVFGAALAAIYLAFVWMYSHAKKQTHKTVISVAMGVLVIFEAGYNSFDTIFKIDKEVYYSSKKSYSAIMDAPKVAAELESIDDGLYRTEKTFFRNVNDNQAYGFKGLSHSSSVMNTKIINFIETLGYSTKSYETRYDGNTPLADSLLGIKYVIDDPSKYNPESNKKTLLSPYYEKVRSMTYNTEDGEKPIDIYRNNDALPIAFMADDDILRLSFLGNDNPFNSMNNFLSSMTGNTPSYDGVLQPKEYFWRIEENPEVELNECTERDYDGQHCYDALPNASDPTVRIHITPQSEQNLYMYLKSNNQKKCNVWVSTTQNKETGEYEDFVSYGSYYDGYDYSIVNLGSFPEGREIEVRLTIIQQDKTGANEYIMVKDFQFYHFNYDMFHEDIQTLQASPLNIDMDKLQSNRIVGEIDAKEGQIMYTSIPYEPGWTVKVDGKKVDEFYYEEIRKTDQGIETSLMRNTANSGNGQVVILNALMGLRLTEGHHTIEMAYSPPGFKTGVILLIFGIAAIILFYLYDRKNNPVLNAIHNAKKQEESGQIPVSAILDKGKANNAKKAEDTAKKGEPEKTAGEDGSETTVSDRKKPQNTKKAGTPKKKEENPAAPKEDTPKESEDKSLVELPQLQSGEISPADEYDDEIIPSNLTLDEEAMRKAVENMPAPSPKKKKKKKRK